MNTTDLSKFENLREDKNSKLIGGFSSAISGIDADSISEANNCKGGNCKITCGSKKKKSKAKGTNGNCKGNCVTGCGGTLK